MLARRRMLRRGSLMHGDTSKCANLRSKLVWPWKLGARVKEGGRPQKCKGSLGGHGLPGSRSKRWQCGYVGACVLVPLSGRPTPWEPSKSGRFAALSLKMHLRKRMDLLVKSSCELLRSGIHRMRAVFGNCAQRPMVRTAPRRDVARHLKSIR